VRTIEVQGRGYELASLMERRGGQLLDGLISLAIVLVGILVGSILLNSTIGAVIGVVVAILYRLFQDGLTNGQSWGKKIVKTKVIHSRTASPCTFGQSFVRNLLLAILGFIDWLFIFGGKRQRLGDKVARTLVVKPNGLPEFLEE
jgi:uncharacterized RDD family membrane protein YckC